MEFSQQINPEWFDPKRIDPEMQELNRQLEQQSRDNPARWEMALEVERGRTPGNGILQPSSIAEGVSAENFLIDGPGGKLLIRKLSAKSGTTPAGVYLHHHGGGMCMGSAHGQDGMLSNIVLNANVVVLSVEYRLAPEHPFPAAPADAEAAAWWLVRNAAKEFGTEKLVLGGESAGAYMSVMATLRLRDRHDYTGLAGINLNQGAYDLRMTPSVKASDEGLLVNRRSYHALMNRFVPGELRNDPEVSPLFYDLKNLPPALFTAGSNDPCLDDSLFMYMRWIAAGNQAGLEVFPGGFHGFMMFNTAMAQTANARIVRFVRQACGSD